MIIVKEIVLSVHAAILAVAASDLIVQAWQLTSAAPILV
jgi:hypothetical protein